MGRTVLATLWCYMSLDHLGLTVRRIDAVLLCQTHGQETDKLEQMHHRSIGLTLLVRPIKHITPP